MKCFGFIVVGFLVQTLTMSGAFAQTAFQVLESTYNEGVPAKIQDLPTLESTISKKAGYRLLKNCISQKSKPTDLDAGELLMAYTYPANTGAGPLFPSSVAGKTVITTVAAKSLADLTALQKKMDTATLKETETKFGNRVANEEAVGLTVRLPANVTVLRVNRDLIVVRQLDKNGLCYAYAWPETLK